MARVVTEQACANGRLIFVTGTEAEVMETLGVGTGLSNVKYIWTREECRIVVETFIAVGNVGVCYFSPTT